MTSTSSNDTSDTKRASAKKSKRKKNVVIKNTEPTITIKRGNFVVNFDPITEEK